MLCVVCCVWLLLGDLTSVSVHARQKQRQSTGTVSLTRRRSLAAQSVRQSFFNALKDRISSSEMSCASMSITLLLCEGMLTSQSKPLTGYWSRFSSKNDSSLEPMLPEAPKKANVYHLLRFAAQERILLVRSCATMVIGSHSSARRKLLSRRSTSPLRERSTFSSANPNSGLHVKKTATTLGHGESIDSKYDGGRNSTQELGVCNGK